MLLSSAIRPPTKLGVGPLIRLAKDAGCDGLSLEEGCLVGQIGPIAAECLPAWMSCSTMCIPMAESRVTEGKRLPYLCANDDREERLAAITLAVRNLQMASELGMQTFVLAFGRVTLSVSDDELFRRFDSGGLAPWELRALKDELEKREFWAADACRHSLDDLAEEARRLRVKLLLRSGSFPSELPAPLASWQLMAEFAGAPIALAYDPARFEARKRFGLTVIDDVLAAVVKASTHTVLNDAMGIRTGFLPGFGDLDWEGTLSTGPKNATRILAGQPGSPEADVAAAADRFRA